MTFRDEWLPLWCGLYDRLSADHSQALYNAVSQGGAEPEDSDRCIRQPELAAFDILAALTAGAPTNDDLLRARTCLLEFDQRYRASPRHHRHFRSPPDIILRNGHRHVLTEGGPSAFWRAIGEKERFRLDHEIGLAATLALHYHWARVPHDLELAFSSGSELNPLRGATSLRIALAPFAGKSEQRWRLDEGGGRTTVFCHGAGDADAAWAALEPALAAARDKGVSILVLPELTVDEALLGRIQT